MSGASVDPAIRVAIGDIEIIAVTDGFIPTDSDKTVGLDSAECERLCGHGHGETFNISVNEYILRTGGKTLLIDAGSGTKSYPSVGLLPENLRRLGIPPESIDAVLMTHLHSDHMHGLVDADGLANFPNAELVLHEEEANFWLDKSPTGNARVDRNLPFVERNTRPYRERLRTVREQEAYPGIRAHLSKGHTPGHTTWFISSGRERAIMWGDTVHFEKIQIPRPDIGVIYDLDPGAAAQSRRAIFDMCVDEGLLIMGAHIAFPGFGRLERQGVGFALLTEV